MNYEDESYVRLYTRITLEWRLLGWEGQAVMLFLMKGHFDRAGCIDIGSHDPSDAISALTSLPIDVVRVGMPKVLESGMLEHVGQRLVWPNFIEAQTATKAPKERQAECRRRKRDMVRAGIDPSLRESVIYFVQSELGGSVKIGRAQDLAARIVSLGTGRPDKLLVIGAFTGTLSDERALHDYFSEFRDKGEWFHPDPSVIRMAELSNEVGAAVMTSIRTKLKQRDTSQNESSDTKNVTPILAHPISTKTEKEIYLPPSRDEHRRHLRNFTASLTGLASRRPDVNAVHEAWRKTFGREDKFRDGFENDPNDIASAIDAHGLDDCLLVARYAQDDLKVSGVTDERKEKHDSIRYIFGNENTFCRILKLARKRESEKTTETAADMIARRKREVPK